MSEQLFGKRDPVDEHVTLNGMGYAIVGRLRKKDPDSNYSGPDNNKVFVPFALGNLEAKRDWGFAPEYVECMWRILQQDKPDDFVIGTGETHSVREFLHEAFSYAGLDIEEHVRIDPKYFRPTEVDVLIANPKKSGKILGWKPVIKFRDLVKIMVDSDLKAAGLEPIGEADRILKSNSPERWWNAD